MPPVRFSPLTVEDAVEYLLANMPLNYEIPLITMKKDNLFSLHFLLGAYARDILGLWSGNEALLESCRLVAGNRDLDADDSSMLIIVLLWERLQKNNTLGLANGRET